MVRIRNDHLNSLHNVMRLSLFFFNYLHNLRVVTSLRLDIDESQESTLLFVAIKYKYSTYFGALNFTCIYNKA